MKEYTVNLHTTMIEEVIIIAKSEGDAMEHADSSLEVNRKTIEWERTDIRVVHEVDLDEEYVKKNTGPMFKGPKPENQSDSN